MDYFERKYISVFKRTFINLFIYIIDDIVFILTRSKEQFIRSLDELNTKHDSIKFEFKISKTSVPFLDTEVYIKNNKP